MYRLGNKLVIAAGYNAAATSAAAKKAFAFYLHTTGCDL